MKKEDVNELKLRFYQLRGAEGKSFDSISVELGVSKPTLIKWERSAKYLMDEIRSSEIQNLISTHAYCLKARLEVLIKLSKRLEDEVLERNLVDVPANKLVDMLLATNDKITEIEMNYRLGDDTYSMVGLDRLGYFTED
jgi:transcriptional regulator with XRE-family HTH domain